MDNIGKKALASIFIFFLIFSTLSIAIPAFIPNVEAQAPSIKTSADEHGKKFWRNWVKVEITDEAYARNGRCDNITVSLKEKRATLEVFKEHSIKVGEVGDSGVFEFFMRNETANISTSPSLQRSTIQKTVLTNLTLKKDEYVTIIYSTAEWTLEHDHTEGVVTTDRDTAWLDNKVYVYVYDPDLNLDPTKLEYNITKVNVHQFTVEFIFKNGTVKETPNLVDSHKFNASETGVNTAKFYNATALTAYAGTITGLDVTKIQMDDAVAAVKFKYYDYDAKKWKTASINIARTSGSIEPLPTIVYSPDLKLKVNDPDRNSDTGIKNEIKLKGYYNKALMNNVTLEAGGRTNYSQRIEGVLLVGVWNGTSIQDYRWFNLTETDINTGIFETKSIDFTWKASGNGTDDIITVRPAQKIEVVYFDTDLGKNKTTARVITTMSTPLASIEPEKASYRKDETAKFFITKPGLNDASGTVEVYSATLAESTTTVHATFEAGTPGYKFGTLAIKVNDVLARIDRTVQSSVSLIETGADTGVFKLELKIPAIKRGDGSPLADGDIIKVVWKDLLYDPATEVSTTIKVGIIKATITFDRDVYPVTAGDTVKVRITIRDPDENTDPRIAQTIAVGDNPGEYINITAADGSALVKIAAYEIGRTVLFTETEVNTGEFKATIDVTQTNTRNWINAKLKIVYYDKTVGETVEKEVIFQNHDTVISVDRATAGYGEIFKVTVNDPDRNLDSERKENNTVRVYVVWTNREGGNATAVYKDAKETERNSGIFVADFKVGDVIAGINFRPKPGSNLEIRVFDKTPIGLTPSTAAWPADWTEWSRRVANVKVPSHTGSLTLSATEIGPGGKIIITLVDPDENSDIASKDIVDGRGGRGSIRVKTDSYPEGYTMYIKETDISTGIFERKIQVIPRDTTLVTRATDPDVTARIYGKPGDRLSISYIDKEDATGVSTTLTKEVAIKSWDPVIEFEKTTYMPGDLLRVFITDPDANKDPDSTDVIPSVSPIETDRIIQKLIITSTSDPVGVSLTAVETDKNTGRFMAQIPLTSQAGVTGTLYVKVGDIVTVQYKDEFPADWVERIGTAEDKAKLFTKEVVIKSPIPTIEQCPASTPELVDTTGAPIVEPKVGQLTVVRAKVTNKDVIAHTFTYIIQIKDAAGVVVHIAWIQDITLAAGTSATPGITWVPTAAGSYTIEVYIWESLEKPIALSPVFSTTVTVT